MVKICIIIIYSPSDTYSKMLDIQQKYLQKFQNITFYFTQMVEDQTTKVEIDNNFINVKGEETFLNILETITLTILLIFSS